MHYSGGVTNAAAVAVVVTVIVIVVVSCGGGVNAGGVLKHLVRVCCVPIVDIRAVGKVFCVIRCYFIA